jgi:hypothetical protein
MDQFEAYLNNPTSAAALSSFVLYLQRVPLGGRSIEDSGRQDIPVWEPAVFFQDKWSIRPNVTLNLGLRWEGYNSPGPLTPPDETPYARYFSDPTFPTDTGEIPDDWSGWQPRVGITWDPKGDGRTVVRANAGLFKARTPSLIWANPRTANGVIFATYTGVIVQTPDGNFNFGVPTFPDIVSNPSTAGTAPGVAVVDKDFKNPESRQIGVSVEREVVPNLAVGAAYNFAKTRYLSRFTDPNVDFSFTVNSEGRRVYAGVNSPNRPFPTLGEVLTTESTSRSQYHGLILTLNKRYSDRWQMQANWTISDDKSDDDNERDPFTVRYADLLDLEWEPPALRARSVPLGAADDRQRSDRAGSKQRQPRQRSAVRQRPRRRAQPAGEGQPVLHDRPAGLEGVPPQGEPVAGGDLRGVQPHEQRQQHRVADQRRAAVRLQRDDPERRRRPAAGADRIEIPILISVECGLLNVECIQQSTFSMGGHTYGNGLLHKESPVYARP